MSFTATGRFTISCIQVKAHMVYTFFPYEVQSIFNCFKQDLEIINRKHSDIHSKYVYVGLIFWYNDDIMTLGQK